MRRRGLLAVPVVFASMALGAPSARADDALKMYRVTVDSRVSHAGALGVDLGETGYRPSLNRHRRSTSTCSTRRPGWGAPTGWR